MPLRVYILSLSFFGMVSYVYKSLLSRWLVKKYKFTVETVKLLNDKVVEIKLAPIGPNFGYQPGQFIFINFKQTGINNEAHPFSIASFPGDDRLSIVVKSLGDFTSQISNLQTGIEAEIEGPYGRFSYKNAEYLKQIWIAGGIGITPFVSMARSLVRERPAHRVDLYYCTHDASEAVLSDDLRALSVPGANFKFFNYYSSEQGRINAEYIKTNSEQLKNKDIFLCGPIAFMVGLKKQLLKMGVAAKNIHLEEFSF